MPGCKFCGCVEYQDCTINNEACENCIDGACGFHKKLDNNGEGIPDIPDWYELCPKCDEYYEPEEEHNC